MAIRTAQHAGSWYTNSSEFFVRYDNSVVSSTNLRIDYDAENIKYYSLYNAYREGAVA